MCQIVASPCPHCTDARVMLSQLQEAFILSDAVVVTRKKKGRTGWEQDFVPIGICEVDCPICANTSVVVAQDGRTIEEIVDERSANVHKK